MKEGTNKKWEENSKSSQGDLNFTRHFEVLACIAALPKIIDTNTPWC
jgi:hypothetical protein